jgi:hypothetical protein
LQNLSNFANDINPEKFAVNLESLKEFKDCRDTKHTGKTQNYFKKYLLKKELPEGSLV